MKKALLLTLSLLALLVSGLRAAPANVNFASERGLPFQLVFDGRPLTRGEARQVHIDRLAPGYHMAEFFIPTGYGRSFSYRTRVFLDPGLETSYVLIARNGYPPMLQKVGVVALRGYGGYGNGGYGNGDYHRDNGGYRNDGYQSGGSYDPRYQNQGQGSSDGRYNSNGNSGYGNGGGSYYYNGQSVDPANGGQPAGDGQYGVLNDNRVMQPQDVSALIQSLKSKSFDNSRLSVAKQALGETAIQADDLKRLLGSFDFEASRVDLAKFAYAHVADRQNFYRVYEAFDFESSAQEVQRAIGQN